MEQYISLFSPAYDLTNWELSIQALKGNQFSTKYTTQRTQVAILQHYLN